MTRVDSLEEDIARADHGSTKLPYDRALNIELADAAEALRPRRSLEALPEFLKEVPVLDVAAAAACGLVERRTTTTRAGPGSTPSLSSRRCRGLGRRSPSAPVLSAALPIEGADRAGRRR